MPNIKTEYGTASQGISITLASLGNGSAREGAAVDNSANKFLDALVYLALKVASGTIGSDQAIRVWFYGSEDGVNYTDNATGSDAGLTMRSPSNLRGPFIIATPTSNVTYKIVIASVAYFFGGVLPVKWGVVIENRTGLSLSATESDHTKEYRGAFATVA